MTLPLEKAYYAARATSTPITFGISSNNNPQVSVEFEILDEAYAGETITWIGTFSDLTAARSIESLQVAGWTGDELFDLDCVPASHALANEVSLMIEGEEYEGQWRPKVQFVNRPGGGKFAFKKALAGSDLKAFSAQMRSTVQSVRASGGAPRGRSSSGGSGNGGQRADRGGGNRGRANAPGDRDDIPPPSDNDRW